MGPFPRGPGSEDKIGFYSFPQRWPPEVRGAGPTQRAMQIWVAASGEEGGPFLPLSVVLLAKCSCFIRRQGARRLMKAEEMNGCLYIPLGSHQEVRNVTPDQFLAKPGHWEQLSTKKRVWKRHLNFYPNALNLYLSQTC